MQMRSSSGAAAAGVATLVVFMLALQVQCYYNKRGFPLASHSNFVRSNYYRDTVAAAADGRRGDEVWCRGGVCHDVNQTCCFNRVCKATLSDASNCGTCGSACGYGLACCGGRCVDLLRDARHCGNCGTRCGRHIACDMGICGYGGDDVVDDVDDPEDAHDEEHHRFPEARFPKQW